jgi:hypothetical protein
MPKRVRVSEDDTTYYTLPGNTAELSDEFGQLDDTIFGQGFASTESGLLTATLSANGIWKGFAGYIVSLKKGGDPVVMTAEAMSLVSGKTYKITNAAHNVIDIGTAITVLDNAVAVDVDDILNIDYILGQVTFQSAYTPTTPITITGAYLPLTEIAGSRTFTLTQTSTAVDDTDIPSAKANGGWRTYDPTQGLKTVGLEIGGVYKSANGWREALTGREEVFIEINPDNQGDSFCRGLFKYTGRSQSGDVGDLEEENLTFGLSVPQGDIYKVPFAWSHSNDTTLSQAIRILLDAWATGEHVFSHYLPDGTTGWAQEACVTDISLQGGLESMNEFTANLQLSGPPTAVP